MRTEIFVLSLLALAREVLASPCLPPRSSSSLSVATTVSSETVSTASTESSTASATESATATTSSALSTASTESTSLLATTGSTTVSASESVTTSVTLSASTESTGSTAVESTTATTSSAISTASTDSTTVFTTTESTTTSGIQSTTTSAEPEPEDPDLIVNGGFEASTPQPWSIFNPRNPGTLSISTDQFYKGQQSGFYEHHENYEGEMWGMYQELDKTRLVPGQKYLVTIYIRTPNWDCSNLAATISTGNDGVVTRGKRGIMVGNTIRNWHYVNAMFQYDLPDIDNTPGVAIISECQDVSFWVDEVSMVKWPFPG